MSHLHHKVSALVDGELTGGARARAIDHLRGCDACCREVEQTLALKHRLGGLAGAEPSVDLFVRLGALRESDRPGPTPRLRLMTGRKLLVGAGSISVAVMTLAYVAGGAEPPTTPTVAPPVDEFTAEFAKGAGVAPLSDPAVEAMSTSSAVYAVSDETASPAPVHAVSPSRPVVDPRVAWTPLAGPGDDVAAVAALEGAVLAPDRVAYSGVREVIGMTHDVASVIRVRVEHVPGQGTSFEVTGTPDQATATFIAQGEAAAAQSFSGGRLELLVTGYDLTTSGVAVVAGRPATVISARRGSVLVARFFIDNQTGLMLRREVYDGVLVRVSAFESLRTSHQGFISHLPPELGAPVTTAVSTQFAPVLDDGGYACPSSLSDSFELTTLNRLDAGGDVIHAAYSDGLSSVSVFEKRGRLDAGALEGFRGVGIDGARLSVREGLPTVAVWESEGMVYTMVTDAPMSTVAALVTSLPHHSSGDDDEQSGRLVRGFERLGSLVTPGG